MSSKRKLLAKFGDRPVMVCIALLFVMAMMTGFTTSRHVTSAVDGRTIDMNTTYRTPTTILRQAGVNMNAQDEYHMTEDNNRTYIAIYRAVPVTVEYQGKIQTVRTSKPTVGELLSELGYDGAEYDAAPGLNSKIQENLNIKIKDVPKPAPDPNLIQTAQGQIHFQRTLYMEASAYLPSDGGGSGITATGMAARQGVVAVDPDVIPLGTRLYIPGYGLAVAADTGGAIVGSKIDLCMEDYTSAINFGRRDVQVYVLD